MTLTFKLDRRHSDNMRSSWEVLKWFYYRDFKECSEWMSYVEIEGKWRYVTSHSSLINFNLRIVSDDYYKLKPESWIGMTWEKNELLYILCILRNSWFKQQDYDVSNKWIVQKVNPINVLDETFRFMSHLSLIRFESL